MEVLFGLYPSQIICKNFVDILLRLLFSLVNFRVLLIALYGWEALSLFFFHIEATLRILWLAIEFDEHEVILEHLKQKYCALSMGEGDLLSAPRFILDQKCCFFVVSDESNLKI